MGSRIALPARYSPVGAWRAVMRADMVAAYLDYRNTVELARAIVRGEAPRPTHYHGTGRSREPAWSKAAIDDFAAPRSAANLNRLDRQDLVSLV